MDRLIYYHLCLRETVIGVVGWVRYCPTRSSPMSVPGSFQGPVATIDIGMIAFNTLEGIGANTGGTDVSPLVPMGYKRNIYLHCPQLM